MSSPPVILITGAAQGIGLETARQVVERGWRAIGADIIEPEEPALFAGFYRCDLRDETAIVATVADLVGEYGTIDGLVNNAVIATVAPFLEAPLEQLDAAYQVNVRGLFRMAQEVARIMVRRSGGSIVNLSSVNAERGVRNTAVYSLSKGAVAALTRTIAVELAHDRVRCNAIAPAPTATNKVLGMLNEEQRVEREVRIPLGRLGNPTEVAAAIVWLLSSESNFVTGCVLPVDGGYLSYGS